MDKKKTKLEMKLELEILKERNIQAQNETSSRLLELQLMKEQSELKLKLLQESNIQKQIEIDAKIALAKEKTLLREKEISAELHRDKLRYELKDKSSKDKGKRIENSIELANKQSTIIKNKLELKDKENETKLLAIKEKRELSEKMNLVKQKNIEKLIELTEAQKAKQLLILEEQTSAKMALLKEKNLQKDKELQIIKEKNDKKFLQKDKELQIIKNKTEKSSKDKEKDIERLIELTEAQKQKKLLIMEEKEAQRRRDDEAKLAILKAKESFRSRMLQGMKDRQEAAGKERQERYDKDAKNKGKNIEKLIELTETQKAKQLLILEEKKKNSLEILETKAKNIKLTEDLKTERKQHTVKMINEENKIEIELQDKIYYDKVLKISKELISEKYTCTYPIEKMNKLINDMKNSLTCYEKDSIRLQNQKIKYRVGLYYKSTTYHELTNNILKKMLFDEDQCIFYIKEIDEFLCISHVAPGISHVDPGISHDTKVIKLDFINNLLPIVSQSLTDIFAVLKDVIPRSVSIYEQISDGNLLRSTDKSNFDKQISVLVAIPPFTSSTNLIRRTLANLALIEIGPIEDNRIKKDIRLVEESSDSDIEYDSDSDGTIANDADLKTLQDDIECIQKIYI
jgi:hypothetical protein